MDINRNAKIVINDDLLRKIVYCIEKAIGDDLRQYLRENYRETNNAVILLRGDNINTNLRTHVVKGDIDLVPFQRRGWSGRMVIDRKEHITYSIMTEGTLSDVLKKKNRVNPHYLQSVLYAYKAENGEIKDIKLRFLDKDFNIVDEEPLEQYIKPDFARLTDIGPSKDTDEIAKVDKKSLVTLKRGIKPKLREIEKEA